MDGANVAKGIRAEIAEGTAEMKAGHGVIPGLAVVLVGDNPASAVYVRNKERAANEAGMLAEVSRLSPETTQDELLALLDRLNGDQRFHGIIVQLPLPRQIKEEVIIEAINPDKDVDGLHPINIGRLVAGRPRFVPATPAGIQQLLLRGGHDPEGKHVVVCGRSNIVGKPIANLLMQRVQGSNATVTVCHTRTRGLDEITRQADILIASIGRPMFITADMVKEGVVVIDVGINRVDAPERKCGYRLVGDVDFEPVSQKAAAITPVPGGVGPMTIAMLLENTLKAARFATHPELIR
jgi:methylenetetrahydrofolate dehydrogenase (NADP+)/methenyltetrahydrofolate cyclohydrolase